MLLGVAHLHAAGFVHRDVKLEHFFTNGGSGEGTVKLADFSSAALVPKAEKLFEVKGTLEYMSPEMVCHEGYGAGTDVWSVGVAAYAMIFRQLPFGRCDDSRM